MFTICGEITQPFIKATLEKNNTSVLALIMIYDTISDMKSYRVFSCVIYDSLFFIEFYFNIGIM